mmetsp:Transcript_130434/g.260245  ORF Transcript_130434/g.260245 Transcript_130434/m.260245 type:complete len:319 (-) Transcript_130434:295-1251(-)
MGAGLDCCVRRKDEEPDPVDAYLDQKLLNVPSPRGGVAVPESGPPSARKTDTNGDAAAPDSVKDPAGAKASEIKEPGKGAASAAVCMPAPQAEPESTDQPSSSMFSSWIFPVPAGTTPVEQSSEAVPPEENVATEAEAARVTSLTPGWDPCEAEVSHVTSSMLGDEMEARDTMPSPSAKPQKAPQLRSWTNWFNSPEVGERAPDEPQSENDQSWNKSLSYWYGSDSVSVPQPQVNVDSNSHQEASGAEEIPVPPCHFYNLSVTGPDEGSCKQAWGKNDSFVMANGGSSMMMSQPAHALPPTRGFTQNAVLPPTAVQSH